MFKNAIFYRFTEAFAYTEAQLNSMLGKHSFTECKNQELSRIGFTEPGDGIHFAFVAADNFLITARKEEKMLPPKVIRKTLSERVKQIESEQSRKVYRKEKLQLKDEIVLDMLPRAFSKYTDTRAIIMPKAGLIVVEAGSFSQAEELLSLLRDALGSLPVVLPSVNHYPAAVMSDMLSEPAKCAALIDLHILDSCELKDPSEEGGTIKVKGDYLYSDEIIAHIEAGKQVTSLAFEWYESYRFTLHEDLRIKGIKMTDQLSAEVNEESSEDPIDRLRADVFLHSAALVGLWINLAGVFGGEAEQ